MEYYKQNKTFRLFTSTNVCHSYPRVLWNISMSFVCFQDDYAIKPTLFVIYQSEFGLFSRWWCRETNNLVSQGIWHVNKFLKYLEKFQLSPLLIDYFAIFCSSSFTSWSRLAFVCSTQTSLLSSQISMLIFNFNVVSYRLCKILERDLT
jgi:hypothetical protein